MGYLYIRSSRSNYPPFYSGKGISIHQYSYLLLIDLWCHFAMDDDNLETALLTQIQVSIALIGKVRKPSVNSIIGLAIRDNTAESSETIQATTQREIRIMLHPSLCRQFRMNDHNLHVVIWHILCFQTQFLPHPELKHIRPCLCCFHGMVSHQLVFASMQRKWSKVSFITSSKMLYWD